jgi:pSer/pThr/pTyr-binding forkhead associated (FHA) protein
VLPAEVATVACRAFVRVESGFYMGLEWPLDRASTVIGRGTAADLVLNEATISRAHALLAFRGDQLFVQDLGSTNGTLVNGVANQQIDLKEADELKMGRLVLRIRMAEERAGG